MNETLPLEKTQAQAHGFGYLLLGFKLIRHPSLRRFVLVPLIINIVVFITLFGLSIHFYGHFVSWVDQLLPAWLKFLDWLLWIAFFIAGLLFVFYAFTLIANIISAPFNVVLSQKVECLLTGTPLNEDEGMFDLIKDIPRSILRELQKLGYYLPRMLVMLVLFFIPGIQLIAPVSWFSFNAWMMTIQYLDYPFDNHKISLPDMRTAMAKRRWFSFSFGCGVLVGMLIPLFNLLVMPAAVAGATAMWCDKYQER